MLHMFQGMGTIQYGYAYALLFLRLVYRSLVFYCDRNVIQEILLPKNFWTRQRVQKLNILNISN